MHAILILRVEASALFNASTRPSARMLYERNA